MTLELERVVAEPDQLTRREREIVALLMHSDMATTAALAERLSITETTVKYHVGAILRKFGLVNRTQIATFAWEHGGAIDGLWFPHRRQRDQ